MKPAGGVRTPSTTPKDPARAPSDTPNMRTQADLETQSSKSSSAIGGKGSTTNFNSIISGTNGQPPSLQSIPKKISLHSSLPNFKDVQPSYRTILFASKLRQCCKMVRQDDSELRKLKHMILYQLLDYINSSNNIFPEIAINDFFACVSANIFRATPKPACESYIWDADEDEASIDTSWYHLQFIYEMLLRFVFSANASSAQAGGGAGPQNPSEYQKLVRRHITQEFILKLVQLFNSSDPRERDYVKTILHRIYANFMLLRSYIRNIIKSELTNFMNNSQRHNGICEVLEILGSIINGFAVPLKAEHSSFLASVLIPLHRVVHVKTILPQLSYCIGKFVEKDASLSVGVISGIFGYWPRLSNGKEVSFLTEVEELLEIVTPESLYDAGGLSSYSRITGPRLVELSTGYIQGSPEYLKSEMYRFDETGASPALPREMLVELRSIVIYRTIFYHVAQCLASSHFQVAERACNMLLNTKISEHVSYAYTAFQSILERHHIDAATSGAQVVAGLHAFYNVVYMIAKPLSFNAATHWNINIKMACEGIFRTLAETYPSVCRSVEERFVEEVVFTARLVNTRCSNWAAIVAQADLNLGGPGVCPDDNIERIRRLAQLDIVGVEESSESNEQITYNLGDAADDAAGDATGGAEGGEGAASMGMGTADSKGGAEQPEAPEQAVEFDLNSFHLDVPSPLEPGPGSGNASASANVGGEGDGVQTFDLSSYNLGPSSVIASAPAPAPALAAMPAAMPLGAPLAAAAPPALAARCGDACPERDVEDSGDDVLFPSTRPHRDALLNPNVIPFRKGRSHFVPGYIQESMTPGRVLLAVVPNDPINRVFVAGLHSMGLTLNSVDSLVDLVDAELARGVVPASYLALAQQNNLVDSGASDVVENMREMKLPTTLGGRKLANRKATAAIQPGAMSIRRKSLTPVTMEVKVAKAELHNYVSPSGAKLERKE